MASNNNNNDSGSMFNLKADVAKNMGKTLEYDEYFNTIFILALKMGFLFVMVSINFVALSIALNCNKNATFSTRLFSGIFAFFFGFIYIVVNFYTYRILTMKKMCEIDKERLFPF